MVVREAEGGKRLKNLAATSQIMVWHELLFYLCVLVCLTC